MFPEGQDDKQTQTVDVEVHIFQMFEFFHINETLRISLANNGCLFLGTVGPMKALASFRREPGTCEALNQSAVSCERGLTRDVRARVIAFLCCFSLFCCSWGVISRSDTQRFVITVQSALGMNGR